LCFSLGFSAGVMVYVSFVELFAPSVAEVGFFTANMAFFAGVLFIMALDFLIPHDYIEEHVIKYKGKNKKIMMAGVFTALGLAIHNFPEGFTVLVSSLKNINLGITLAIAIALHNIPEGLAVSVPVYHATKSRKKAFLYSVLSGLTEPIGAIIGYLVLLPFLTSGLISIMLAFVAGIMVFISFDELLPLAYENGKRHLCIAGIFLGMLVMAISLHFISF